MSKKTVIFTAGTLLGISIAVSLSASADRLSQFNEMAARKGAQYGVNPNFMIRQGKLVKSKISGVSIVGESKDKIPPEVLLMGEYKNMASR